MGRTWKLWNFPVVQCLRIHLLAQGMWVQLVVGELHPTWHRATKPSQRNYRAHSLWNLCSSTREKPKCHNERSHVPTTKTRHSQINNIFLKRLRKIIWMYTMQTFLSENYATTKSHIRKYIHWHMKLFPGYIKQKKGGRIWSQFVKFAKCMCCACCCFISTYQLLD